MEIDVQNETCLSQNKKKQSETPRCRPSRRHSHHCLYCSDSQHVLIHSELQSIQQTTEPSSDTDRKHKQVKARTSFTFFVLFYFAKMTNKNIKTKVAITFYLLRHAQHKPQLLFLSPSLRHHRRRPVGEDTARHCPRLPLSWRRRESASQLAATVNGATVRQTAESRLIYYERSCVWWFLVWAGAVWPLKNTF